MTPGSFNNEPVSAVPPGSWARYDAVDFTALRGRDVLVRLSATCAHSKAGATIVFRSGSPDGPAIASAVVNCSGTIHRRLDVEKSLTGFHTVVGRSEGTRAPEGAPPLFMVFDAPPGGGAIGVAVDWFRFVDAS